MDANSKRKLIVLTEGHSDARSAKTAISVIRYRPDEVVAVLDSQNAGKTTADVFSLPHAIPVVADLDDVTDANTLLIGIVNSGGKLPDAWTQIILRAISKGMNVISGLHQFLSDIPVLANAAKEHQVELIDVRKNSESDCSTRKNIRDNCLRVQTVGNDCSVGKMVAAIEVTHALKQQGHDAKFVATGQTGIMIEGDGCPIDCVVSDFVNGAAEKLVHKNQHHDILMIEGQGSLAHPRFSAVTLGLLHGCAPQALILCYEVGRKVHHSMDHVSLKRPEDLVRVYEDMGSLIEPTKVIGVAMNSSSVSESEADSERRRIESELDIPACDVLRHGAEPLVTAILNFRRERFQ